MGHDVELRAHGHSTDASHGACGLRHQLHQRGPLALGGVAQLQVQLHVSALYFDVFESFGAGKRGAGVRVDQALQGLGNVLFGKRHKNS